ncbi:MAG: molybdopterin-binding protein [Candidatus Sumerlaeota bacterium]|nr:molybdopterin-binding protein [Candidatus Sumerlaeota bacterium]
MSNRIEVVSVNVSKAKGTAKSPAAHIVLDALGVQGDAHAGPGLRQVSLLAQESMDRFAAETGQAVLPGDFAENVTLRGLDLARACPLDRFRIGEAELEVTQIGKECHGEGCAIFRNVGRCVMPKEGVFCRVRRGGVVRPGDFAEYLPRTLRVFIITSSDRAASGEYEDRGGPRIQESLEASLGGRRENPWRLEIAATILPDEPDQLRDTLKDALDRGVDVIFTTGGTGVGPRDCVPETVAAFCDKMIPGIMERIRAEFGARNPRALLSRSVAGVAGTTAIYTLPGSPRAVDEYMGEILQTLEHLIYMIHGLDAH